MLKLPRLPNSLAILQTFLLLTLTANVGLGQVDGQPPEASDPILLDDVSAKKSNPIPPSNVEGSRSSNARTDVANPDAAREANEAAQRERAAILAERRRKASAGLAAVAGIAILGVSIIAVAMIWAKRLRRIARDPLPVQRTAGNDFWFLKPPKPTVEDKEIVDAHRPEHPPSDPK